MEMITFKDDRRLLQEYADFGCRLYEGDSRHLPPCRGGLESLLSIQSALSENPENDYLHFLLRQNGKAAGRVSAFVNQALHDRDGTPVGTLGQFECVNDYAVASDLIGSATQWLSENWRRRRIWGPMNFDIWHGYRFKTAGFEEEPFVGEPYNKPYYPEQFARYGFTVKAEWDSLRVSDRRAILRMIKRGENHYRLLCDRGYRFEHITLDNLAAALPKLHRILCTSFAGFLGFTEISVDTFASLFAESLAAFDPDLAVLVYNEEGNLAGFAVACIELAEAVRAMAGKTGVWSRLKFAYHRKRSRTANFYIGGVTAAEIARRSGLGRAGFYYTVNRALDKGYDTILLTLRLKNNLAHGLAARSGCVPQSEYALFEWNHE